jgi:ribonucleotide monophosphatase NagD (HAD superfamily)
MAIGDGVKTDIAGAAAQHIDSVYVASRVHMAVFDGAGLNAGAVSGLFAAHKPRPIAAVGQLSW